MIKNKKGIAPLIIFALIVGGFAVLLGTSAIGGWFTGNKLTSIFNSIPPIGWVFIVLLLVLLMLRRRRK